MLRKTTCAVGSIAIACAAACSIALIALSQPPAKLDLRWLHAAAKADRLPVTPMPGEVRDIVAFDLPSLSTTIVSRSLARPRMESAVRRPPATVRTIPVQPVREVPNDSDKAKPERLPVGCEPAFSPVTTPAFAHISVRCDS
jgi:hypothetical protein